MKIKLFTFLLASIVVLLASTKQIKACVNPDSVVIIIVNYDTVNAPLITEVEIRLTNLRLMTENKNKICSCALSRYSNLFSSIDYIAFVDSGTNNPYLGFAKWNMDANASSAWNNSVQGVGWEGYIADVINSGLSATSPVDLVIRASTPSGFFYTLNGDSTLQAASLKQAIESESLGTDEWSTVNNDLVASHQGVRGFNSTLPGNSRTYVQKDISYFIQLDNDILKNIPVGIINNPSNELDVKFYPVPVEDELNIRIKLSEKSRVVINVYNVLGKNVLKITDQEYSNGTHLITSSLSSLEGGMYLVEYQIGELREAKRVLIK